MTLLGLDLGTSSFKVAAYDADGAYLGVVSRPTPWRRESGRVELEPEEFTRTVRDLVDECAQAHAAGAIVGVGVTGMAETMFVETDDGRLLPARAWNQRGSASPRQPDAEDFVRTGLLEPARTPLLELRRITDSGERIRTWSGLPEHAVRILGGARIAERSLAARTGLVDVVAGGWDPAMLAWAGVDDGGLPELQPAGRAAGEIAEGACAGAVVTVAGHDHVTAALGAGVVDGTTVFDSLGTGEAVIAQISPTTEALDLRTLRRFTTSGFNVGFGVGENDVIAFGGLGTGNRFNLLLGALAEAGFPRSEVMHPESRAPESRAPASSAELLETLFGPNWQELRVSGVLSAFVADNVADLAGARALWWAAVVRASRSTRRALDVLAELVPQASRVVAAGGWLGNAGIREVREQVLGPFTIPPVEQSGARGAALLAGLASGCYPSRADFPPPERH